MSERYDIVIVGAGPTGLMLAASIVRMGPYKIKLIDGRAERTKIGKADGIQARSLDILRNMGLKRDFMAYDPGRIYEVAFWNPSPEGKGIHRADTWKSYPSFIDTRYPFTTILHQGRIERIFLDDLRKHGVHVDRPRTISGFTNDGQDMDYPIEVHLTSSHDLGITIVRTKYLFGAEGARSPIRQELGIEMVRKDRYLHVWSVVDGTVKTDFPDIQMKCTVHSDSGSAMIIPQGHNVVRIYIQFATTEDHSKEWKLAPLSSIQDKANQILKPYKIEWEHVDWHSVYPIGQALVDRYTLDERIFIGGDACHTHSPKAGQGMNFGWLDAHNFAWKFHLVEAGFLRRSVLKTYEDERRFMAAKLIDFDSRYSALFSTRIRGLGQSNGEKAPVTNGHTIEKDEFKELYKQNSEFTGGYAVDYGQSCLTLDPSHLTCPDVVLTLNGRLQLGRIFPTATVNRVYDARVCHLEQEVPLNGSFRIYLFSGEPTANRPSILKFASDLVKPTSFFTRYQNNVRLDYEDRHTPHSKFFTFCIIFSCARSQLDANKMLPGVLAAYKYQFYADDAGERVGTVHEKFGIDATKGGAVVVRPDGHVACAFALEEGTVCAMDEYFGSICTMGEE